MRNSVCTRGSTEVSINNFSLTRKSHFVNLLNFISFFSPKDTFVMELHVAKGTPLFPFYVCLRGLTSPSRHSACIPDEQE